MELLDDDKVSIFYRHSMNSKGIQHKNDLALEVNCLQEICANNWVINSGVRGIVFQVFDNGYATVFYPSAPGLFVHPISSLENLKH